MVIKEDQVLPDVCCKNYGWQICLLFTDSIYGICENPDCPVKEFEDDPYQGVSHHSLDNLEDILDMELRLTKRPSLISVPNISYPLLL